MLKRKNKILVGTLVLFLVMAVGYAIFTQTLKINGTASANGDFNLTYECFDKEEHGGTGTCLVKDNTVTTTSTLTKPSDYTRFAIKITNTGSIPAVLKEVTSPNNVLMEALELPGDEVYFDKNTFLAAYYIVGGYIDGNPFVEGNIYGDQAVADANITLQPGETIYVTIDYGWLDSTSISAPQPELPEGGATMTYNVTFRFDQVTV